MNGKRVGVVSAGFSRRADYRHAAHGLVAACEARGWPIVEEFGDKGSAVPKVGTSALASIVC